MEPIKRFEDLECWKAARQLVKIIFQTCETEKLSRDRELSSQLKRAAISVMNNLAEGFGRFGDKDRLRFYDMAKASSMEIKSMLYILEDIGYVSNIQINQLRKLNDDTLRLTCGWIRYQIKR